MSWNPIKDVQNNVEKQAYDHMIRTAIPDNIEKHIPNQVIDYASGYMSGNPHHQQQQQSSGGGFLESTVNQFTHPQSQSQTQTQTSSGGGLFQSLENKFLGHHQQTAPSNSGGYVQNMENQYLGQGNVQSNPQQEKQGLFDEVKGLFHH